MAQPLTTIHTCTYTSRLPLYLYEFYFSREGTASPGERGGVIGNIRCSVNEHIHVHLYVLYMHIYVLFVFTHSIQTLSL